LMGTTVVSKATVDGLKANLQRAEARSAAVHQTNNELSAELSVRTETDGKVDDALTKNVLPITVESTLEDVPVLIIATEEADKDALAQTVTALGDAGARLDGTLVVDDRMVLNESDTELVRDLLDIPARSNVQSALNRQLAIALAGAGLPGATLRGVSTTTTSSTTTPPDVTQVPPPTTVPAPVEPELIGLLRQNGLLSFRAAGAGSSDAPVLEAPELAEDNGYRYVIVSGNEPDPVSASVLIPLIDTMGRLGPVAQVAATGPNDAGDPGEDPFLTRLLDRDGVKGRVSTVDNLGSFDGSVATVFALVGAAQGQFGSYGIGETATAVVPAYDRTPN
ncbi:MAG TPA: copper transporter, partial [Acidimicrobiales bacterium]|nr:copper transporter [Acidimicrobiales bacterium]